MKITMIYAADMNNVIGKELHDGTRVMPWGLSLKEDLRYFKAYTIGKRVVMGSNTFASMDYTPLPKRVNIVLTRHIPLSWKIRHFFHLQGNLYYANNLIDAIEMTNHVSKLSPDIVIIGGAIVFETYKHLVDEIVVTRVEQYTDLYPGTRPIKFNFDVMSMFNHGKMRFEKKESKTFEHDNSLNEGTKVRYTIERWTRVTMINNKDKK